MCPGLLWATAAHALGLLGFRAFDWRPKAASCHSRPVLIIEDVALGV